LRTDAFRTSRISRFGWAQVLAEAGGQLAKARVFLVGMCHRAGHGETEQRLREAGLAGRVSVAHDGGEFSFAL
jgi:hypothetical protein